MAEPRQIKVTLLRSTIGCSEKLRKVILALGLYKTNQVVQHKETDTILGMLHKVSHLIKVEAV